MFGKASLAVAAMLIVGVADAQLRPYEDFEIEEAVWNVQTVRVDPTRTDYYLEGLQKTWIVVNEVAKKLGQIEDYFIMVSDLPFTGDFNVLLGVKYKDDGMLAPSQTRYQEFMAAFGEREFAEARSVRAEYPKLRIIVGEYRLRHIHLPLSDEQE